MKLIEVNNKSLTIGYWMAPALIRELMKESFDMLTESTIDLRYSIGIYDYFYMTHLKLRNLHEIN